MTLRDFFVSMFSETPGVISFSRVISFVIVGFIMGWDTSFIVHGHALPETSVLLGQASFMSTFYLVNRAAGVFDKPGN
jgi:hypothetical protein